MYLILRNSVFWDQDAKIDIIGRTNDINEARKFVENEIVELSKEEDDNSIELSDFDFEEDFQALENVSLSKRNFGGCIYYSIIDLPKDKRIVPIMGYAHGEGYPEISTLFDDVELTKEKSLQNVVDEWDISDRGIEDCQIMINEKERSVVFLDDEMCPDFTILFVSIY